mgnify:CR=1 FL=1
MVPMNQRRAASEPPAGVPPETETQALRARLLGRRRALSEAAVSVASSSILGRLDDELRVRRAAQAGPIGLYLPVRGEPDVRPPQVVGPHPGGGPTLMDGPNGLTLPGHPAARPRMLGWNPGAPLATAWGTLRYPVADATEVEPSDHGLILVPGVAFDPAGNRLGSGGGWYDRLLAGLGGTAGDRPNASTPLLVGVAHQFQLVEHLEVQRWDVPMHLIVVRRDLTGYQHLHPELQPDGSWTTRLTLPEAGAYRFGLDATGGDPEFPSPTPAASSDVAGRDGLQSASA